MGALAPFLDRLLSVFNTFHSFFNSALIILFLEVGDIKSDTVISFLRDRGGSGHRETSGAGILNYKISV